MLPVESWLYTRVHNSPERGQPKERNTSTTTAHCWQITQNVAFELLFGQWDFWGDFQTHFELLPDFEKLGMQYSQDAFLFFLRQIIMQLGIAGLGLLQSSRSHEFPLMTAPCRYLLATTLPKFLISCQFWAAAAKLELIFQFPYWRAAMQSSPKIRHHQLQKREEKT